MKDLGSLFFVILIWQVSAQIAASKIFPTFVTCMSLLDKDLLLLWLTHFTYSLLRIGLGLFIGSLLGVAFGIVLGRHKRIDQIFGSLLFFTYSFPKAVLAPILVIVLGIGEASKVSLVAIISFFQLAISCRDTVKSIDPSYILTFRSIDKSKLALYRYVILPASLPGILSALRISLGTGLGLLFFVEGYGTDTGIGYFIWDAFSRFDFSLVYLGCFLFCMVGWLLFRCLDYVEKKLCSWV